MIDNLTYKYHGNQLIAVDDAVLTDNGYDFADNGSYYNGALREFKYDANGNATRDNNKGILSIGYNRLNLPVEVSFSKDNKLEYLYDATGTKLRQDVVVTKNLTKRTDFISNFVIVNNAPAWINFDEGRVIMDGTNVNFTETHLKDHLGNTRVVFGRQNNALVIKQVNSYYPFGMNIKGLSTYSLKADTKHPANEYLYNGKMFQDELGLDWLDYGARMYDAVLGRWHVADELAEEFTDWSPYCYALNNPVFYNDPTGMFTEPFTIGRTVIDPEGKIIYHDDSDDKGIYESPDGQQGRDGNTTGLKRIGTEDPSINYRVGDYLLRNSNGDFTNLPLPYKPVQGGNISLDYTFEGIVIPVYGFLKVLKIGKYLYKAIPTKSGKWVFKLIGISDDVAKGGIQLTKKTFGHTFTNHGDDMTNFLINRAKGSGMAQGQFLDNQKAAQFILDNVGKTANGVVNIPIPKGFPARIIMPDGTFKAATHIRLVPGGGGVKTAYPLIL